MIEKIISSSLLLGLALLLAACESGPVRAVASDEPMADETPAAGSQAEADAVAEETTATDTADFTQEAPPTPKPAVVDEGPAPTHASATAVLPPAWIYRGALSTALLPGTAIFEGDRIETGAEGRVQLILDDNGTLQLGGNTQLIFSRMRANETSSLNGTLDLSKGSFAYESGTNGTLLPGDLDFQLGNLTASVSQSALMGRNTGTNSLICLLGGSAQVTMPAQAPVMLVTPKACVTNSKTAITNAGTSQQVTSLQQDTRPPTGIKAMKSKGTWALILTSEASEAAAKAHAQKLWKAGYPGEVIETRVKGKAYYRVALRGFESREAANGFKKRAIALGYKNAWASGK